VRAFLSLGLIIVSSGAFAAPAPATALQTAVSSALASVPGNAMRLSQLANPTDKILELGLKAFQAGFDGELKKSPEDAAFFAKNPGLQEAIWEASRPLVRTHLLASIPSQQRRYAEFYTSKFSTDEIDQLVSFYSSPTGTKVIRAMYAGVDLGKLAELSSPGGKVSARQVEELKSSSMSGLADEFDADDWRSIFTFMSAPVHAKLLKLAPEFNQLVADIGNEPTPELDAALDKVVREVVADYFAKRKAKSQT